MNGKPLILNYAIPQREKEGDISYEYNFERSMNVINESGCKLNLIDIDANDLALMTKTKVKTESDDNAVNLLGLSTKTEVSQESDDVNNCLLENN